MFGFSIKIKNFITYKIRKKEYIPLLKRSLLRIIQILKMIRLTIIIKAVHENCNIEELVDFSLSPRNNILQLQQYKSEIISLLKIIRELQPKIILEIGTFNGGTLFLFSRIISKDTLLISLDLPKARLGRFQIDWRFFLIKKFSLPHQKMRLLRADSHRSSTLNQIKKILDGQKLDFLFIDADHSYEGVKKDFEMYGPLVKRGGIIAFHDIVSQSASFNNVHKFWEQIKNQYKFDEFVSDSSQITGGIGILKN
jgi:predicted O-methyltransferase YrrM